MPQAMLDSLIPTPLLREWVKATLASGSWKDALAAAVGVSIALLWCPLYF